MRRILPRSCLALLALFWLAGCNTPDSISVFCASSSVTLTEAAPILHDLAGSCLRSRNLRKDIGSFDPIQSDPACDAVAAQAESAVAAATLLARYFNALNALASFNTVKSGDAAGQDAQKAAAAFQAGSPAQDAVHSIAAFLTTAATSGYQQKNLANDLTTVSANVATITDALATIVEQNYIHQELGTEENNLAVRYKTFARQHPDGALLLQLDDRWHTDLHKLELRRASANDLITSLHTIREGTAALAANAHHLKAKQLPALLRPYTTQLQLMIPKIQEAF